MIILFLKIQYLLHSSLECKLDLTISVYSGYELLNWVDLTVACVNVGTDQHCYSNSSADKANLISCFPQCNVFDHISSWRICRRIGEEKIFVVLFIYCEDFYFIFIVCSLKKKWISFFLLNYFGLLLVAI